MAPLISGIVSMLIQNNLPKVAQAVVDKGVDYVSDKLGVELKPEMPPEQLAAVRERAMQHEEFRAEKIVQLAATESEEVTKRLQADMISDSWLSKNVRPATLVYILTAYLVLAILDGLGFKVAESYITLLGQWGMLVMSFYFGGRSLEKAMQILAKRKEAIHGATDR